MTRRITLLMLTGFVAFGSAETPARGDTKQERKVRSARWVCEEAFTHPSHRLPRDLLADTRCVVVVPDVVRAALGLGANHGNGVVSCRDKEGVWSPPAFVKITGGSLGLQAGYETSDLMLFFVTDRAARALMNPQLSFGGDLRVAAGSFDRQAGVTTKKKLSADIYAYVQARGLFAGASVEGSRMSISAKANRRFYGRHLWPEGILFRGSVEEIPEQAQLLMETLSELPWKESFGD